MPASWPSQLKTLIEIARKDIGAIPVKIIVATAPLSLLPECTTANVTKPMVLASTLDAKAGGLVLDAMIQSAREAVTEGSVLLLECVRIVGTFLKFPPDAQISNYEDF